MIKANNILFKGKKTLIAMSIILLGLNSLNAQEKKEISIRELDEKAKEQGISGRNMRDVRSRMKNELEYQVNEKQYSLKRMIGGRVIEANTDFYRYLICHLPSIGA